MKTQRQEATAFLVAQEGRLLRTGAILALVEQDLHSAALSVRHARERLHSSGPLSLQKQDPQRPWSDTDVEDLVALSSRLRQQKGKADDDKEQELNNEKEEGEGGQEAEGAQEEEEEYDQEDIDWDPRS